LAELGGSIFVERRNRSQVDRDLSNMTQALRDGFNVMIYPEGTSTNGLKLLPFKKSLLMAAVEAERDIMPVVLKYVSIDGEPFGPNNCDKVCWYGKMSFVPHFIQLMGLKKIKVRVEFLPPIKVTKDSSRNELAEKCFNAIHTAYFGYPPAHDSVGANQTSTVANASSSGSAAAAATTSSAVSAAGRDNSSMN
jgi:1-acyl-sn-glycerol-3-phosphate acyltransferase